MSNLHFDWGRVDFSSVDLDLERTKAAQNITALTEKILTVEQSMRGDGSWDGPEIPFPDRLVSVLRRELEKEYEYLDLFDKIEAMHSLGVI